MPSRTCITVAVASGRMWGLLLLTLLLTGTAAAADATSFQKNPPYYFRLYGAAVKTTVESYGTFLTEQKTPVQVKGPFSVKEFRSGDLRVTCYFELPALRLAAVKLHMGSPWSTGPVQAALGAYGTGWHEKALLVNVFSSPEGSVAINLVTTMEIQSSDLAHEIGVLEDTLATGKQSLSALKF